VVLDVAASDPRAILELATRCEERIGERDLEPPRLARLGAMPRKVISTGACMS
jgi:hypothetical protein